MLLTISTTHRPATDIGYLLVKHPDRFQSFEIPLGRADVFYPQADEERCTVALLLHIDQVGLARPKESLRGGGLQPEQYVNDRPYVASSHLSVALNQVFRSALAGVSKDRPELAQTAIPLEAHLPAVPSRKSQWLIEKLFEPLGYQVKTRRDLLDPKFPEWGQSPYVSLDLSGTVRLKDLLAHLYVLLPVLDDNKHYYIGEDEVQKLMRFGEGWLAAHPHRELISRRYLKHQRSLQQAVLDQMPVPPEPDQDEQPPDPDAVPGDQPAPAGRREERLEKPLGLAQQRTLAVLEALRNASARRVLDLGCGEGRLTLALLKEPGIAQVTALETSTRDLERARRRIDRLTPQQQDKATLLHGSLTYRDQRLQNHDAAVLMEVIEHIDPPRLDAFEEAVFGAAKPGTVLITTPNREYNVLFEGMAEGAVRHPDHRFEWTRQEFQEWAQKVSARRGYHVGFQGIGSEDPTHGAPTQMGIFSTVRGE